MRIAEVVAAVHGFVFITFAECRWCLFVCPRKPLGIHEATHMHIQNYISTICRDFIKWSTYSSVCGLAKGAQIIETISTTSNAGSIRNTELRARRDDER